MKDKISVIMSTYNEDLIMVAKSIESILNQTYSNLEFIIIIDNPLNLELKELLYSYESKDERIKVFVNEKNMGLVKSLNAALNQCSGKYVARMDADDISVSDRLMIQKDYLENQKLDFVFSSMMLIDVNDNHLHETNKEQLSYTDIKRIFEKGSNISTHPTWFLKKELYDELNGYREVLYCEDYDFVLRCLLKGYKIGKINHSILMYRIRENSISRTHSLEQYLNSKGILKLYKSNKLEDMNEVIRLIQNSKKCATNKEKEKFMIADSHFIYGIQLFKKKRKIDGLIRLIKSFSSSKYYTSKNLRIIKNKLM